MNCEIIKDLMPLYVENLSSESSNSLIQEHLKNCKDCNEMLNNLKVNIEICDKEEIEDTIPLKLIKRIKRKIFIQNILSALITLIIGIFFGFAMFTTATPMFIAFTFLVSFCSFTGAIFISISISQRKNTLRERFKSVGNWTIVFSIIICFLFFVIFKFYFNETNKMVFIIALEIFYNIFLTTSLRLYARFKLPEDNKVGTKKVTNSKLIIVAFTTLLTIFIIAIIPVTIIEKNKIVDDINLPFVSDASVIGKWTTVDFVKNPDSFNPDNIVQGKFLPIKEMTFYENGKLNEAFSHSENNQIRDLPTPWLSWTKNYVMHKGGDHVASNYEIREINNTKYLFVEWKTGDYTYFHMSPPFIVLKYNKP